MATAAVGECSRRHEHHHHRSKRSGTRHRHEEGRDREPAVASDAPNVEELRRARTEYYMRPPEERRHKRVKEMVQGVKTESRKETAEASAERQAHTRRSRGSRTKRRAEPLEEEDEAEYVYSRPRGEGGCEGAAESSERRKDVSATRSQHEGAERERPSVSRSYTRRRKHRSSASVEPLERIAEQDTRKPRQESTDGGSPRRSRQEKGEPSAAAQQPHRKEDPPRLTRTASTRDPAHAQASRPLLKRSNTTTTRMRRASVATPAAPPTADKSAPSPSPSKSPRKTSNLFTALFSSSNNHTPPPLEKSIECLTCASTIPTSKAAKLSCGHRMCHACLRRIFTLSATDPAHMPPRCCTAEHIPLKHVEKLLSERFKAKWNLKYQEYTTRNRLYCPARGCGEWIKPGNISASASIGRKAGKCPRCKTKACAACGRKWHGRRACASANDDEETRRLAALAREKGWQRCFDCGALVELKEGCNHMTCRCTAEFCMLCGARWKSCDCPWFNAPAEPQLDGDRLNHMVVPEVVRNVLFGGGGGGGAPLQPPYPAMQQPPLQRPPPPPPGTMNDRRAQERADEALARRLQMQALDDEIAGRRADDDHDEPHVIDVQVFGLGNAGQHHMNETYRVQPPAAQPPPRPAVASGWNFFGFGDGGRA